MHGMQSALQRRRHSQRRINVEKSQKRPFGRRKGAIMKLARLVCCALIALTLSQFLSVTGVRAQAWQFFGVNGELLFSSYVRAAPGDGNLSFFGVKFNDARIARVRITTGNTAPGPDDDGKNDIVMMDDFIYGEPRALP